MKKMINDYILNNKKIKDIYEKEKESEKKRQHSYYIIDEMKQQGKTSEEIKQYFLQNKDAEAEEKEKQELLKLQDKKKIYNIKENILYNNIIITIYNKYKNNFDEIIKKYEGKNIGEKTREKIADEIKQLFLNDDVFKNDDIFIYIKNNFDYGSYYLSITIEISKKQNFTDGGFKYIYDFKLEVNYGKYNNCYENIENKKYIDVKAIYTNNDDRILYSNQFEAEEKNNNYNFIDNVDEIAKNIIKINNKNKLEFEKIKNKLSQIRKNNDSAIDVIKLSYKNLDYYKLPYNINLY